MKLFAAALTAATLAAPETGRGAPTAARVAPPAIRATAPTLADNTDQVLLGDVRQRPALAPRDRSLVTLAALVAGGHTAQLTGHLDRALDNGVTPGETAGLLTHLAFYAGWPSAMSAAPVAKAVLAARAAAQDGTGLAVAGGETGVEILRHGTRPTREGPTEHFTGSVRIEGQFQRSEPARVGGATVSFAPGARTAWHAHPLGQTLIVTGGRGLVQREGGPVEAIGPGDVVWFAPGEKHWHGAAAGESMTHVAIAEACDGKSVTWMEKVSDEQYGAGAE